MIVQERNDRNSLSVSVVTPAYNEENHIEEALNSVKNQNYDRIEHVVVDDGSTDCTPEILLKYEEEYNLKFIRKQNFGQAQAVNDGFRLASGDIVVWLNADDKLFDDEVIGKAVNYFSKNPSKSILYGNMAMMDVYGRIKRIHVPVPWFDIDRLKRWYFGSFVFMRSKIPEEYKVDENYEYALDYEYYLRIALDGISFGYTNDILYSFRQHKNSKTSRHAKEMAHESKQCRRKHGIDPNTGNKCDLLADKVINVALQLYGISIYNINKK